MRVRARYNVGLGLRNTDSAVPLKLKNFAGELQGSDFSFSNWGVCCN